MSFFKKLFGGAASSPAPESVVYKGFSITPTPIAEGTHHRVSALIEKDIAGEPKSHILIRADTLESHEAAAEASVNKAKQMIDQVGDRLFD